MNRVTGVWEMNTAPSRLDPNNSVAFDALFIADRVATASSTSNTTPSTQVASAWAWLSSIDPPATSTTSQRFLAAVSARRQCLADEQVRPLIEVSARRKQPEVRSDLDEHVGQRHSRDMTSLSPRSAP